MESLPYRLEIEARQQIREHLDDHVQKHLAIDSDDYTIREAEKLLSGILRPVSSTGPTDIGPPKDFVGSLLDDPSSSKPSFLEDRLSISSSVFQWLKQLKVQLSPAERARAERDLSRFALDDTIHSLSPHHPMDLLISRRSKHQTPTIGDGASVKVLPSALKDVETRLGLSPVVLPALEEPVLNQEQILSLRFSLDMQTKTAIGNLLSSLPPSITSANRPTRIASSRRQEFTPAAITDFLHNDDPTPFVSDRMSPPLFPRVPPSLARRNQVLGNDLSDLHKLIGGKVDIEQDELDHLQESFKLVDGLHAIPELSSSTVNSDVTSPESSQRGRTDKYWCPSSDGPDVELDQWKMEEVEFPRSKRIGQATSALATQAPGITSMQDIIGDPVPGDAQFPPKWNDRSLDQMSHSIIGASASIAEDTEDKMDLDDVDSLLVQVYKDVQAQDPFSVILKEKVDQRDSWLMEVPDLPEPCGCSSSLPALPHLSIMLAPPVKKGERAPDHEDILEEGLNFKLRLRKVGGMRINLSWSPFIRGETTIPTLESVTGLDGDLTLESQSTDLLRETQVLLSAPRKEGAERSEDPDAASSRDPPRVEDQSLEPILLSRLELRRLASAQRNYELEASDDEDEELDELEDSDIEMVDEAVHAHSVTAQKEDFRQQPAQRDVAQQSTPGQANPELESPMTFAMEAIPSLSALPASVTRPTSSDPTSLSSKPNRTPLPHTNSTNGSAVSVTVTPNKLTTNSNKSKLLQFLNLRGRPQPLENEQELPGSPQKDDLPPPQSSPNHLQELPKIPEEVLTHCSFHIDRGTSGSFPQTVVYKYIASFDMIQKRGIYHHLNSGSVGIYLVERPNLTDVDLIVDAGAAIIYLTLSALPAEASNIAERVSRISPEYSRLLLVFEAYPPSKSRTAPLGGLDGARISKHEDATAPATLPYAFSPPVLKAFKHLRRSLVIAESTGEKLASCRVDMAFALDEEESARFARIFGDARVQDCHTDTNSAMSGPWDDRSWLIDDAYEGEVELASFEGLNLFASIAMLRLVNLDSIIGEMTPEQRLSYFANEVGRDRVIRFNHLIEMRLRAFASPSTTP